MDVNVNANANMDVNVNANANMDVNVKVHGNVNSNANNDTVSRSTSTMSPSRLVNSIIELICHEIIFMASLSIVEASAIEAEVTKTTSTATTTAITVNTNTNRSTSATTEFIERGNGNDECIN